MKNIIAFSILIVAISLVQISCVKGCIDDNALNYDPEATANRGCIYPETVNVISIGIKSHPAEDNTGAEWDLNDSPDKFIKVFNNESNELLYTTEIEGFTPVSWTVDPILSLLAKDLVLRFEMYDQDPNEDVLMDEGLLNVNYLTGTTAQTSNDLYPSDGTFSGANGSTFSISLDWSE